MEEAYGADRPFQEDLHYSFLEYGGGLLANYDFGGDKLLNAAVTANRICIVADRDRKKEKKHEAWEQDSNGALLYVVTTGREIENELSPALVKAIVAARLRLKEAPDLKFETCRHNAYLGESLAQLFAEHELAESVAGWKVEKGGTLKPAVKQSFAQHAASAREHIRSRRACSNLSRLITRLLKA